MNVTAFVFDIPKQVLTFDYEKKLNYPRPTPCTHHLRTLELISEHAGEWKSDYSILYGKIMKCDRYFIIFVISSHVVCSELIFADLTLV